MRLGRVSIFVPILTALNSSQALLVTRYRVSRVNYLTYLCWVIPGENLSENEILLDTTVWRRTTGLSLNKFNLKKYRIESAQALQGAPITCEVRGRKRRWRKVVSNINE